MNCRNFSIILCAAKKTNEVITSIEKGIDSETLLQSKELVENINDIIANLNKAVQAIDTKNLGFKDKDGKPLFGPGADLQQVEDLVKIYAGLKTLIVERDTHCPMPQFRAMLEGTIY